MSENNWSDCNAMKRSSGTVTSPHPRRLIKKSPKKHKKERNFVAACLIHGLTLQFNEVAVVSSAKEVTAA